MGRYGLDFEKNRSVFGVLDQFWRTSSVFEGLVFGETDQFFLNGSGFERTDIFLETEVEGEKCFWWKGSVFGGVDCLFGEMDQFLEKDISFWRKGSVSHQKLIHYSKNLSFQPKTYTLNPKLMLVSKN